MATFPIYQIYVELEEYKPKMWRRFQVMSDITIARLCYIIMSLYEIRNFFSYEILIDEYENYMSKHPEYLENPDLLKLLNKNFSKIRYGITRKRNIYMYKDKEYGELRDSTKEKLMNIIKAPNEQLTMKYDPEINWTFKIKIEKVFMDKKLFVKELPKILDGNGYGIIEQIAGTKSLQKKRQELKNSKWANTLNYKDFKSYDKIGAPIHRFNKNKMRFNIDIFDVEDMNYRIHKLQNIFRERYEQDLRPTMRQIKILKRRYIVHRKK